MSKRIGVLGCKAMKSGIKFKTMNIKINIVELATDLAHTYLEENHRDDCSIDGELTKIENGVEVYNEEAQHTFDWLYDDYYNHLMKFKTI